MIGFTTNDNVGTYGLEEYYNDILCGTNGREYGYLNDDSTLERTTIPARDGYNIQTTIDANIQAIVEKYLKEFNEEYKDSYRPGNGAEGLGCIIMEVNTGNILAMADYPNYDLNDTRNKQNLIGMPLLDDKGNKVKPTEYVTQESLNSMDDELMYQHLNALWKIIVSWILTNRALYPNPLQWRPLLRAERLPAMRLIFVKESFT